ncbi:Glu-tRNA(Gln) amidotransferase subunit GatE [Candidatus Pacearchaeota archaeon]|nr:Glu-tRNA(Gln) amidotransferase subunit GatE [Candidatus Pacearchaeota archaeon]
MKEEDYSRIKLKVGIEIHQQLDTNKLFCECPSTLRQDNPNFKVKRKLRAVSGEEGTKDIAAEYEHFRERNFVYEGYNDTTCLVELDEEPPHEINKEALKIAIQLALMLNCGINPVIQVMRKTVVDGSNTSGFQRTLLLAEKGFLEIDGEKIGIQSICLEEDACKKISENEKEVTYRLDRLGIPLVEIATDPDITNPEQAKKVSLRIGEILRACNVKRGLGTIRQDVNMSIQGKERTEIKGVQEPDLIIKTIQTEIERQKALLELKKPIGNEVRKANIDGSTTFLRPLPGKARMYPETDIPLIIIEKKFLEEIKNNLPRIRLKEDTLNELSQEMNKELAKAIIIDGKLDLFEKLVKIYGRNELIAKMLSIWPKEISSHEKIVAGYIENVFDQKTIERILKTLNEKKIEESDIKKIMGKIAKGSSIERALVVEKIDSGDLEKDIKQIIKEKPGLGINAYMGLIMQKHKGKVNALEIVEIIKKNIG